jgi:hypothetical protein
MVVLACLMWVIGTLIVFLGHWYVDKTIKVCLGGFIISCGSAVQFVSFVLLLNAH